MVNAYKGRQCPKVCSTPRLVSVPSQRPLWKLLPVQLAPEPMVRLVALLECTGGLQRRERPADLADGDRRKRE